MAIGSYEYIIDRHRLKTFVFGVGDYHSHLRIRPIIDYAKKGGFANKNVLEIGCGRGLNAYELYFDSNCFQGENTYIGCDFNANDIERAQKIKEKYGIDKMTFVLGDAKNVIREKNIKDINSVMLIDVLEHIESDEIFLKELNDLVKKDTTYVISVPTKVYPQVFGWDFHRKIGHVRKGYTIEELTELMKRIDKSLEYYSYNTGFIGGMGAKIFYNVLPKLGIPRIIREYLCLPFLLERRSTKFGASLFAVFKQENNEK